MAKRAPGKTRLAVSALALLLLSAGAAWAGPEDTRKQSRADAQVIKDLTAENEGRASRAADEVRMRGARMIPHLMKLKGDRRCFFGDMALGSHAGGSFRLAPRKGAGCYEQSSAATVEVAALFLIEAVYRDDLKFAQGATLALWDARGEQRTDVKLNGRELIDRGWSDAGRWFEDFEREGLDALRARGRAPFDKKRVGFY